jgi:hypothetical protein
LSQSKFGGAVRGHRHALGPDRRELAQVLADLVRRRGRHRVGERRGAVGDEVRGVELVVLEELQHGVELLEERWYEGL